MTEAVAKLADALGDRLAPEHRAFYERLIDRLEPSVGALPHAIAT